MRSVYSFVSFVAIGLLYCSSLLAYVEELPGNTPIVDIPADYYPIGTGHWFVIPDGRDAGKKMFFRDSIHNGENPEKTILFVHGNPESSYTYRKVIDTLLQSTTQPIRVVAMDHIGFGLSDQASFQNVAMDHADNLLHLVQYLDLQDVTMIVHDWGGPIGIGAMLQEHHRVSNLVVLNSTVFPMPDEGMTYNNYPRPLLAWAKLPSLIPDYLWGSYASFAIFAEPNAGWGTLSELMSYVWDAQHGNFPADNQEARKFYRDQFQSGGNVEMSKRMVRQSGHWGKGNIFWDPKKGWRNTNSFYQTIQNEIALKWGPAGSNIGVRSVLGRWDPLGKDEVISQWTDNLPQLEGHVSIFKDVGHFIEEVEYVEISDAIVDVADLD